MLTPIEDLVSKSLTALVGGPKSSTGKSFRTPPPSREGVIIPNSNGSEGSITDDRKEGKENTEESIEDDLLERQPSIPILRPVIEVGSIREGHDVESSIRALK